MAAKKKLSTTLVWILMAMLIFGLGGFGITNLSGFRSTVATVGSSDVSMNDYGRALQREIQALEAGQGKAISFAQAQAAGIDRQVMRQLLSAAALDEETKRLGISIGDQTLAKEISNITPFQGLDGNFDRNAYELFLQNSGLKETDFEEKLRTETARTLLQSAIASGNIVADTQTDTILEFAAQKRDVTWVIFDQGILDSDLAPPTDEQLQIYYDDHTQNYMIPERKKITYVQLTPEMILDTVEVDENLLRKAYDDQDEKYNRPEKRLIERLVFPDMDSAKAAKDKIDAGGSFEDAVKARGLELADIDLGDVDKAELGTAGDAVFAAQSGDITGPIETDLGPALFRINAILAAQKTSFDEAKTELKTELAADRARRVVADQIDTIDNELAAGATLEDLARDTDMELGTIDWDSSVDNGIAGYSDFRNAALAVQDGDYPEIKTLHDGGIFALRLDEIIPPAQPALNDVRDQVRADWEQQELTHTLENQAQAVVSELQTGKSFEELGLETETAFGISRADPLIDTLENAVDALFGMKKAGDYTTIAANGVAAILRLDNITSPDLTDADLELMAETLKAQIANGVAQDMFQALSEDLSTRIEITVDDAAINAVNARFR